MTLDHAAEPAIAKAAQVATYSGGGMAAWFAYNAQIIAAIGGLVIGIVGLAGDVAAELGVSVGAVYAAKTRVLARLREELKGLLD